MGNMSLVGIGETDRDLLAVDSSCRGNNKQPSSIEVSSYFRWKGILDRTMAAVLLIPGLPIIGLCIALVRLTSKGPGLYRQTRVGKGRRIFYMYKIRTMRVDAEDGTGPVWTKTNDNRITRVGQILRKTHLDEFPQLLNVIKGEMSLIGPRPERPEFVVVLAEEVPNYLDRIAVKPGITGLAQINLDPDVDIESVCRKLVLDTEYIKKATLLFDMRVLLTTILYIFGCNADWTKQTTGVKREVPRLNPCSSANKDGHTPTPVIHSIPPLPTLQLVDQEGNGSGNGNGKSKSNGQTGTDHSTKEAGSPKPR
jgi:lipopolysaccharide/colanic/teichoic acid biosynthesis glycosyltransferase